MEVYPYNETIKHAQEMYKAMSTYNFTIPVPPNLEIIYSEEMGLRYAIPKLKCSQNAGEYILPVERPNRWYISHALPRFVK